MKNCGRLFVFAGYDKDEIIDDTLLHYLNNLSDFGDIVLIIDSNIGDSELSKLKPIKNLLFIVAERHNEYDFGSYKRGYQYALKQKILKNYDWIYFINDSVYGPLWGLKPIFDTLESQEKDFVGIVDYSEKNVARHIQSWFFGVSQRIAMEKFFSEFMNNITKQPTKSLIILKYEVGLSQLICQHGYNIATYVSSENGDICHSMYNAPLLMLKKGIPFVKKAAISELKHFAYLYQFAPDCILDIIYKHAQRTGILLSKDLDIGDPYKYEKCFRFTLFAIPLITIYQKKQRETCCYKTYIFDKIPLLKVFAKKL